MVVVFFMLSSLPVSGIQYTSLLGVVCRSRPPRACESQLRLNPDHTMPDFPVLFEYM